MTTEAETEAEKTWIEDYPDPSATAEPEPEPEPEPETAMPEETKPEQRTIRLIFDPAIESRGKYQRGQDYIVPADEAEYLLSTGYFEEVNHDAG